MADDRLSITHQLCLRAIADTNPCHLRLFEIAVDPEAVGIDDGDIARSRVREIADPHKQIGDVSVNRTEHLGSLEVNFRLSELLLSSIERSFRLNGVAGIDLLLLDRCG